MTGVCGRENGKQITWMVLRHEDGRTELRFQAEEGAGIPDYDWNIFTMLPPWMDAAREITEITLDGNIEVIGKQNFRGMDRLEKVRFVSEEGQVSHLRVIGVRAFNDCRNLTEIHIPDSVEEIKDNAFEDAERLKTVEIGTGIVKLGNRVFAHNVNLESLRIKSACLSGVGKEQFTLNHCLTVCECPQEASGAAELMRQFAAIYGEDQEAMAKAAASGNLTETVQYALHPVGDGDYRLEITGTGPMPEWTSELDQPWKAMAKRITEVQVAEGITTIGEYAFSSLPRLQKAELPGTIKSVGIFGFGECAQLTELRFHEGLESLSCRSLWGCVNLKKLWLPKSFCVADLFAMAYSTGLEDIYFAGTKEQWEKQVFIDNMMERNAPLFKAKMHFGGDEAASDAVVDVNKRVQAENFSEELSKIAEVIKNHGDGNLHVVAVNLGDGCLLSKVGDSTLIVFPEGATMLIDAGACGVGKRLLDFLKAVQLEHLDYLVFTHPHGDHFGGAIELINYLCDEKKGGISEAWYTDALMDMTLVDETVKKLQEKDIPLRTIKVEEDGAGERPSQLTIDGVEIFVYGPNEYDIRSVNQKATVESSNDVSLVLKFQFGETVFLTGGDIYRNKEKYLLETFGPESFRADVIKMNHHGNFQGNTPGWMDATRPKVAYAETDGNGNSNVMRKFTELGAECYSTGMDGMLHITMGAKKEITVFHEFDSALRLINERLSVKTDKR